MEGAGDADGGTLSVGAIEGTVEGYSLGKMEGRGVGEAVIVGEAVVGVEVGNAEADGERLGGIEGPKDPEVEGSRVDGVDDGAGPVGTDDVEGDAENVGADTDGGGASIVGNSEGTRLGSADGYMYMLGTVDGTLVGTRFGVSDKMIVEGS